MGWLSDNLDFELFNLGDMWDKIKDNPESLILGVDPFSTKLWNEIGVGGGNQEPIVNALGGPMGGDTLGIGSGGVYDRAQEAGIDTGAAMQLHDVAEVVASYYGARGLGGIGGEPAAVGAAGGGGGAAGGGALGAGGGAAGGGLGGGTAVGSAAGGGAAAPAGGGAGLGGGGGGAAGGGGGMFGDMSWMDYLQMMPQGGGQQQQQQGPAGPRPMPAIGGSPGVQMAPPMPLQAMPPRSLPFGLLDEDEEEKRRKELALIGGLL